jgi:hypothetical protein
VRLCWHDVGCFCVSCDRAVIVRPTSRGGFPYEYRDSYWNWNSVSWRRHPVWSFPLHRVTWWSLSLSLSYFCPLHVCHRCAACQELEVQDFHLLLGRKTRNFI